MSLRKWQAKNENSKQEKSKHKELKEILSLIRKIFTRIGLLEYKISLDKPIKYKVQKD